MKIKISNGELIDKNWKTKDLRILTHNGAFHSDEVFAAALLIHFVSKNNEVQVIRTRDRSTIDTYKQNPDIFVLDIGTSYSSEMLNFDHHQDEENVEQQASVMLVLDYLVEIKILGSEKYAFLKSNLIQFISDWDLGLEQAVANFKQKPLPTIISAFNRFNVSLEKENQQFLKVLLLAIDIIENETEAFAQLQIAKEGLKNHIVLPNNTILFDNFNPQFSKLLKECKEIKYYIHPIKNNWVVKTTNSYNNPLPLIKENADLIFAHKNRFLTIFSNQQSAINYISKATTS